MRRLLMLVLSILILSGCIWTSDTTDWAAVAEAEATVYEVDQWPSSVVRASNRLRTDARAGLNSIHEATAAEQISPSIAGREYPVRALCYSDSSVYEDEAPRLVYDQAKAWFEADQRDLDSLASWLTETGYAVTTFDLRPGQTGDVVVASGDNGTLKVGRVPGQTGEYTLGLSTQCFTLVDE